MQDASSTITSHVPELRSTTEMPAEPKSNLVQLFDTATPALASGAIQSVLFNPFDRALYVRVQSRRRRFLDRRNFERPFQGFGNAAAYRTIVGASYIFWQDSCRIWIPRFFPSLDESISPTLNAVCVGLVAGAVNGLALNNLQAIKFRMWSEAPQQGGLTTSPAVDKGFIATTKHMFATGGIRVFFRGCVITMQRDSVFGVTYEGLRRAVWLQNVMRRFVQLVNAPQTVIRGWASKVDGLSVSSGPADNAGGLPCDPAEAKHRLDRQRASLSDRQQKTVTFLCNLLAAVLATMASSPWNFVRSVAYGCPAHADNLHRAMVVRFLFLQTKYAFEHGETYRKIAYHSTGCAARGWHFRAAFKVLNRRLNVGWGSLRVGLGMAVGQHVFGLVQAAMTTSARPSLHTDEFTSNRGKHNR